MVSDEFSQFRSFPDGLVIDAATVCSNLGKNGLV
jgi:hypothetical protein